MASRKNTNKRGTSKRTYQRKTTNKKQVETPLPSW